ncbi:DNA glycosylase AlkZ-like family protein [Actinoplanes nipponensis]|uniref:DNA glycosylase AlkZ-like family protein n=1 Tax=Actinoplanes nipponensis TaxID=135950 RepID=UPI0034DB07B8
MSAAPGPATWSPPPADRRPARPGRVSALASATLRLTAAPELDDALYRRRSLVRTWAARGTLHLLPAADLPLWVAAMSTRPGRPPARGSRTTA